MNPSPVCMSCGPSWRPPTDRAPHNEITLNNDLLYISYNNSDTPRVFLIGMDLYNKVYRMSVPANRLYINTQQQSLHYYNYNMRYHRTRSIGVGVSVFVFVHM